MAPVPFVHPVRYPPLILAAGYISSVVYFTYAVGNILYTSYKSLGPVSSTRARIAQRRRFIPVFLVLAITAFSVATYYSVQSATLSYKTWAYEHGLDLAQWLSASNGSYVTESENSSQLYIQQWLSDTPIYYDALEIVVERTRRFWWGQQIDLATTAFGLMLAIEGRRRNIPLLTAFLALAHLVNLSLAQNLFFLALLLTPSPLPSANGKLELPVAPLPASIWTRLQNQLMSPKPRGWNPDPMVFYTAIALSFTSILILPYTAGTSAFTKGVLLARASTFLPILLPKVIPVRWGSIQQHPHGAYESLTKLFKFFSAGAFILHAKITLVALLSNTPSSHYHRHSSLLPWDVAERSLWERSTSAFGKVLGSTSDHPVVAALGWDAVLCGLSLGIWAAVRGIDVRDMMNSSIPVYNANPSGFRRSNPEIGNIRNDALNYLDVKAEPNHKQEEEHKQEDGHENTIVHRRRDNATSSNRWEAKAVAAGDTNEGNETEADKAYVPTTATAQSTLEEGDESPRQDFDWDPASLTWGLAALGGLASACAGVFGAVGVFLYALSHASPYKRLEWVGGEKGMYNGTR